MYLGRRHNHIFVVVVVIKTADIQQATVSRTDRLIETDKHTYVQMRHEFSRLGVLHVRIYL